VARILESLWLEVLQTPPCLHPLAFVLLMDDEEAVSSHLMPAPRLDMHCTLADPAPWLERISLGMHRFLYPVYPVLWPQVVQAVMFMDHTEPVDAFRLA
jgi:hypothetical protein